MLVAAAPLWAQAPGMQPGLWRVDMTTELDGIAAPGASNTLTRCVLPDQVNDPRQIIPRAVSDAHCRVRDYAQEGDRATWKLVCSGERPLRGSGSLSWKADEYSGVNRLEMAHEGRSIVMIQRYTARRVGDCN